MDTALYNEPSPLKLFIVGRVIYHAAARIKINAYLPKTADGNSGWRKKNTQLCRFLRTLAGENLSTDSFISAAASKKFIWLCALWYAEKQRSHKYIANLFCPSPHFIIPRSDSIWVSGGGGSGGVVLYSFVVVDMLSSKMCRLAHSCLLPEGLSAKSVAIFFNLMLHNNHFHSPESTGAAFCCAALLAKLPSLKLVLFWNLLSNSFLEYHRHQLHAKINYCDILDILYK